MKYSLLTAALVAPFTFAAPSKRTDPKIDDPTILQFALTLEHLENVFYKQALQKFKQDDFLKAGYGKNFFTNVQFIASDEQSHVEFLKAALTGAGQKPVDACEYNFQFTDVQAFLTLSSVLESVGTSAYLGAAPAISNKDILGAAGSILVTEALHTSLQRAAVNEAPIASPNGTPLDPNSVFSLASAFIKKCPDSNAKLPFKALPKLTLNTKSGTCELPDCTPEVFEKRSDLNERTNPPPSSSSPSPPPPASSPPAPPPSSKPSMASPPPPKKTEELNKNIGTVPDCGDKSGSPPPPPSPPPSPPQQSSCPAPPQGGYDKPSPPSDDSTKAQKALRAGVKIDLTADNSVDSKAVLTFVSGLSVVSIDATIKDKTISGMIPMEAMGQSYVFVTKDKAKDNKLDPSSILFGPAIVEVDPMDPKVDFGES